MGERITIKQAVKHVGRSERTIRKWLADGRMTTHRIEGDRRQTILIDTHELLTAAAEMTPLPKQRSKRQTAQVEIKALQSQLEAANALLSEVRHQRDKYEVELTQANARVEDLHKELEGKVDRVHALEMELNGGVKGLLKKLNPLW